MAKECVVTFKNADRQIAMYFTEENGNLDMQMSMTPEFKEGEEPDLPMLLASTFMAALNVDQNIEDIEHEPEKPIIVS